MVSITPRTHTTTRRTLTPDKFMVRYSISSWILAWSFPGVLLKSSAKGGKLALEKNNGRRLDPILPIINQTTRATFGRSDILGVFFGNLAIPNRTHLKSAVQVLRVLQIPNCDEDLTAFSSGLFMVAAHTQGAMMRGQLFR